MSYIGFEKKILNEIKEVLKSNPEKSEEDLVNAINNSRYVFVCGAGRSGLIVKCFAMRLMQAKVNCFVIGETITPSFTKDDLLIVVSGSGQTKTIIDIAIKAKKKKAKIAVVTAKKNSSLAKKGSLIILLKAKTKKGGKSLQPLGSLFEQSAFIFFEGVIIGLIKKNKISEKTMLLNHTNLE